MAFDHIDQDAARRDAVTALTYRLRQRDASDDPIDPELFAGEFIAAFMGRGWRLTAISKPKRAGGVPAEPNEEWRQARAELEGARDDDDSD